MKKTETNEYVSTTDLAELTGLTAGDIRSFAKIGVIPHEVVAGKYVYNREEAVKAIELRCRDVLKKQRAKRDAKRKVLRARRKEAKRAE